MSIWGIVVSVLLVVPHVSGAIPELPGHPFLAEKAKIVWKAGTNNLPARMWVYEEIPREFSTNVVSTVLALGELSSSDKVRVPKNYPIREKTLVRYQSKEKSRTLDIVPAFGWLEYRDTKAVVSTKEQGAVAEVPSPEQARQLALQYIKRLEIALSELAKNSNSSALKSRLSVGTRGWIDKASDKLVKETNTVGINFIRTLDGFSFAGGWAGGGISIDFGNHGNVSRLSYGAISSGRSLIRLRDQSE